MTLTTTSSNGMRILVVNADDFGLSASVNLGVIEARERGIATSSSLMVNGAAAQAAGEYAQENPEFGVGLHADFGEWVYEDGRWRQLYEVVAHFTPESLADELERQLHEFERLVRRRPTHIDSHQHVHREEPLRTVLEDAASQLNVPVRHLTKQIRYCGDFYGQTGKGEALPEAITVQALVHLIENLNPGVTELSCHPAKDIDFVSPYAGERRIELDALCDPSVLAAVKNNRIQLSTFGEALAQRQTGASYEHSRK